MAAPGRASSHAAMSSSTSPVSRMSGFRIKCMHETSRKKGHGIGMWIVNNTIANTGGKILKIEGLNGFKIEFMLGDKI